MKKSILIIVFILLLAGYGKLIINQQSLAKNGLSWPASTNARSSIFDSSNLPPFLHPSTSSKPAQESSSQENITKSSSGARIYKNDYYGIELSYPSTFGDIVAQPDEFIALPITDKGPGECKDQGRFFHKGFFHNNNLDFGLISINYKKCSAQKHSIFDINKVSVSDNKLTLAFWNSDPMNVAIGEVVPLPNSNGIDGYIIKNFIGDASGEAAAVIPTPNNTFGPLIFRISNKNASSIMSYEQGVKLLEQIISQ